VLATVLCFFFALVAPIDGTLAGVITINFGPDRLARIWVTGISCASVPVVYRTLCIHALSGVPITVIPGGGITVVADNLDVEARTGNCVAQVIGAKLFVIADLGSIDTAKFLVTGVIGTGVIVDTVFHEVLAQTRARLTEVISAGVRIVASRRRVDALTGIGIASVNSAQIVVVANVAQIDVGASAGIGVTLVLSTEVAIVTGQVIDTFPGIGITRVVGAKVTVVAIFVLMAAVTGAYITGVIRAEVSIFAVHQGIDATTVLVATIIGAGIPIITVNEDEFVRLRTMGDLRLFVRNALVEGAGIPVIASVAVVTNRGLFIAKVSCARVMVVTNRLVVAPRPGVTIIYSTFAEVVAVRGCVNTFPGFRVTGIGGAKTVVLANLGDILAAHISDAVVGRAVIAIVAIQRREFTVAGDRIAVVRSAGVTVTASLGIIHAKTS